MPFWKKPHESADWLANVAFFEGFGSDELSRVLELSTEVEEPAGTLILDQGDTGQDCFVIVAGSANVFIGGEHVATLGAGSMLGEMSLVDHRPRTAAVVAETPVKLLRFDSQQFKRLLAEMPKAEERVLALLQARLQQNR